MKFLEICNLKWCTVILVGLEISAPALLVASDSLRVQLPPRTNFILHRLGSFWELYLSLCPVLSSSLQSRDNKTSVLLYETSLKKPVLSY